MCHINFILHELLFFAEAFYLCAGRRNNFVSPSQILLDALGIFGEHRVGLMVVSESTEYWLHISLAQVVKLSLQELTGRRVALTCWHFGRELVTIRTEPKSLAFVSRTTLG
uniref:Putative secreted protein n=1 Tax=Amblyomma cajennense TaxID=34607 RepID=A0A023FBU3_AMBCJ